METRSSAPLFESLRTPLLAALAASLLAACGGGGGGGSAADGTGGTGLASNTVSTGVMTKGSVIVNGVRFEDTTQNISIDDNPKTAAALQNGMVVKVVGRVNDDGVTGTAERIKALVEVRGIANPPLATSPRTVVVNGQTVLVDNQTVFSNLTALTDIVIPTPIEVHGLREADGRIRATRIEASAAQMVDSGLDEIRGVVANGGAAARPTTFTLGGQTINVPAAAVIEPTTGNWPTGTVVEVYCTRSCIDANGVFQATRLKVEDDRPFQPSSGQRMEVEGFISGFTAGNFLVGGTPVTTTVSTSFEDGVATDLANNVKVEAEGSWNGTRLVASKIEFKRSVIRLQGNVTASTPTQVTMNVAGRSVFIEIDRLTSLAGGVVPPVNATTCIQVRGKRRGSATPPIVTAAEIDTNCSGGGGGGGGGFRPLMQAPVEAETSTTVRLLGFDIDISNPSDSPKWEDANSQPIASLTGFLDAVTPGTLVKVTFNSGTNTLRQAELED